MIFVYIAGPYSSKATRLEGEQEGDFLRRQRAEVERNILNAVDVGLDVARIGLYPVIPHANTAHPLFEKLQPYQFWVDGTLEMLRRSCDALILVPGWETSSGARTERSSMLLHKKPVFESISNLEEWASTR
jgi:hypothetical protein